MKARPLRRGLSMALLAVSTAALCGASSVDNRSGRITATFTQMGVPVDADFTAFSGSIDFDPANPGAARAHLRVQVASFDIGDAEYNAEVRKPVWFDAARHPQASFTSTAIKPAGTAGLQVQGRFTLKGRSRDVSIPVTVATTGATRTFTGQFAIKRLDYGIGEGEWRDTDVLADQVVIRFRIASAPE
ncbi:MAG: YceI family protein [Gammaproteobacteria bacterium]